jgi:hypothetical protein
LDQALPPLPPLPTPTTRTTWTSSSPPPLPPLPTRSTRSPPPTRFFPDLTLDICNDKEERRALVSHRLV